MNEAAITIRAANADDAAQWDAYVETAATATFFHLFGWLRVIKRVYGYDGVYLMALRRGNVVGVCPLIDVKSPLFGRNLISTAFTVGGGIAADDSEAVHALAEAATEEGRRRRVKYVELRSRTAMIDGWAVKNDIYATFERPLIAEEKPDFMDVPRSRRREVRKAHNSVRGHEIMYKFGADPAAFHALYAHTMRDHGTPIFARRFVDELAREFADRVDILEVSGRGTPVLALLSFYFRDRVMPYYFGATRVARDYCAFDLATWLQMRRGVERGAKIFDFGRSKYGTGSFDFKTYWGFEPTPLEYQYALINARETPNVSPTNPKFSVATAAWRRLPVPIATLAGPMLARHLA